jgi:hypothetical protein
MFNATHLTHRLSKATKRSKYINIQVCHAIKAYNVEVNSRNHEAIMVHNIY